MTADTPVPPDAVTPAARVLAAAEGGHRTYREVAGDMLRASQDAIRADERERFSPPFRQPVAYLIGLVDGMAKVDSGPDWDRYLACFREVRDELAALLPENDGDAPEPPAPGTAAAIAATERERIRRLADEQGAVCPDPDAPGQVLQFADMIGELDA